MKTEDKYIADEPTEKESTLIPVVTKPFVSPKLLQDLEYKNKLAD